MTTHTNQKFSTFLSTCRTAACAQPHLAATSCRVTRTTFRGYGLLAALLLLALAATPSFAVSNTFYSTGAGGSGVDPNYTLVSWPGGGPLPVSTTAPYPGWFTPPSGAQWINQFGDGTVFAPGGLYDYQTTFNWGGGDLAGWFAADNEAEIYLDTVDTGIHTLNGSYGFKQLTQFDLGVLSPGVHTLDFFVNNEDDSPTGLLVGTPEPATLVMFGSGVLGLAGLFRRHFIG